MGNVDVVSLKFGTTTVALAGNSYGKKIFNEQVKPNLSENPDHIRVVIPDQIKYITSSFIQGFFDYWIRNMGYTGIKQNITVQAGSNKIVDYIMNNLY